MGRYRPPAKKGSPYITPEGKANLDQELDYLWNKRRPLVVQALSAAAAEGDRSENAEYIYRKKELGEIDVVAHPADVSHRRAGFADIAGQCGTTPLLTCRRATGIIDHHGNP